MTIRNYISATEISAIISVDESNITERVINEAETMVDNAIASFYEGAFAKAYTGQYTGSGNATTTSSITITGANNTTNIFNRCVIQILSGDKAGTIANVTSNTASVIEFTPIEDLAGTVDFRVYQAGKAPFAKDQFGVNRIIAQEVKEAVAYQVEHLLSTADTPESVKKTKGVKSESIGTSYSVTYDEKANATKSALELLCPQSAQILRSAGLTYQSI